ncbi:MAG: helix-turn-helix domain-containing protein [Hyphomicrobiaceae bacterium]
MPQAQKTDDTSAHLEKIAKELEMLRRLAILDLSDKGFSQADIADALGASQPTISRMFPKGIPKRKDVKHE